MNAEKNQVPNDSLDIAIAALRNRASAEERPSPALVAAAIAALEALEVNSLFDPSAERKSTVPPGPDAARMIEPATTKPVAAGAEVSARKSRRPQLWSAALAAAALAAALLIAVVLTRPPKPPDVTSTDERHVGPIVVVEVDPANEFARMDERLARVQSEMTALADDAQRLMAQQQIDRILADNRNLLASLQSKWPNQP
jgi:hypothetical protein